ncbi:MAG: nucleotidyltransferase domain-containing protein, partial [Candidatus Aenigmatarchaeota archaeon]
DYSMQGRNKLFHFDPLKPGTKGVFEILETHKSLEFQARLPSVSSLVSDLAKCSETVVVFGSYASFRHGKDSDLDVVLLGKCDVPVLTRIKKASPIPVNEHRASYAEFAAMLKAGNPLALEVMKNHVVFGNVSSMVGIFLGASA